MITRQEVLELAGQGSLLPRVVEKDNVIGWLLAAIYTQPRLASGLVFKGGTCLKKCFFETYRFSEDLDFTVIDEALLDEQVLTDCFQEVCAWLNEETGIQIRTEEAAFDLHPNPRGKLSCEIRLYYLGPLQKQRGGLDRVKLDLTVDERLVDEPVVIAIGQPYSDAPDPPATVRCYSYEELFAEKIRALAQRGRPRDLYDVVSIFRRPPVPPDRVSVNRILKEKCEYAGIPIPTFDSLQRLREEQEATWRQMLQHQLPTLPPFREFWGALPQFFEWLAGRTEITARQVIPGAAGVSLAGEVRIPEFASQSALNALRFGASSHLLVDLRYGGSTRRIEPYSLRRTRAGQVVLHAVRADNRQHRSYRVDRIQSASITDIPFEPRYAIELTPAGPLSIPRAARPSFPVRRRPREEGSLYVFECYRCGRQFRHRTRQSRLNPHNDAYGYACSGRSGRYVETVH